MSGARLLVYPVATNVDVLFGARGNTNPGVKKNAPSVSHAVATRVTTLSRRTVVITAAP